jgi:hypothetical protein
MRNAAIALAQTSLVLLLVLGSLVAISMALYGPPAGSAQSASLTETPVR